MRLFAIVCEKILNFVGENKVACGMCVIWLQLPTVCASFSNKGKLQIAASSPHNERLISGDIHFPLLALDASHDFHVESWGGELCDKPILHDALFPFYDSLFSP